MQSITRLKLLQDIFFSMYMEVSRNIWKKLHVHLDKCKVVPSKCITNQNCSIISSRRKELLRQ